MDDPVQMGQGWWDLIRSLGTAGPAVALLWYVYKERLGRIDVQLCAILDQLKVLTEKRIELAAAVAALAELVRLNDRNAAQRISDLLQLLQNGMK